MTEQEFRRIYPPEVIQLMLKRQQEQDNPRNIQVFFKQNSKDRNSGGFDWINTIEGFDFWYQILIKKSVNVFYTKYPYKKINNNILLLL